MVVTNRVSDSQLHAFYRTAHLFWSMSEHEGFCIPLIEAMWFDVPILAFKSSAVPETLGKAGLLFTNKDDFLSLAALAKILVKDEDIKYKVLAAQRRRRMAFTPNVFHDKTAQPYSKNGTTVEMKSSTMQKPSVAFVVQRFGTDVGGGAETLCRMIVEKMSPLWDIEVLTSSAKEYVKRFENDYPPGVEDLNGFVVKRFKIDYLRSEDFTFSQLDRRVLNRTASRDEEMLWLKEIGPYSSDLIKYVEQHVQNYDLFFFFTYLYATTTLILPLVREKSILVPTAHDEPPIFARFFDDFFALPRALICSTNEELQFVRNRTREPVRGAYLAGVGIDAPPALDPAHFRRKYNINGDFLLYVGRIQKEKGCDQLFEYYLNLPGEFKKKYPLVLLGKRAMSVPQNAKHYLLPDL